MNLTTIAEALSLPPLEPLDLTGIAIDSRKIEQGELFVALRGEQFDGHDFIQQAVNRGAAAVLAERKIPGLSVPQLIVEDSLHALGEIAKAHRQSIACKVIALTGSNGKTSVKEMIARCLPKPSWASLGNLNNHIGVPLSVLQLRPEHRYAVFELGANHRGEIAYTVAMAKPEVALINNIAPAHIEGFGSIDGVAKAKGEIYQGLPAKGWAVVNDDDDYAHFWDDILADKQVLRYSIGGDTAISAHSVQYDAKGCGQFELRIPNASLAIHLQVPGEHNIRNALAAAACCYALGVDKQAIEQGLNEFGGVPGRLNFKTGIHQATVIDDTYNANLKSVLSALQVLAKRPGKRIFVFGDMGELADSGILHHQQVGLAARELGIDQVYTCGKLSQHTAEAFGSPARHFDSQEALLAVLSKELDQETTVLVKGSRSAGMEKIVIKLLNE